MVQTPISLEVFLGNYPRNSVGNGHKVRHLDAYSVHAKHVNLVYIACLKRQPRKAALNVKSVWKQSRNTVAQLVQFDSESSCARGGSYGLTRPAAQSHATSSIRVRPRHGPQWSCS